MIPKAYLFLFPFAVDFVRAAVTTRDEARRIATNAATCDRRKVINSGEARWMEQFGFDRPRPREATAAEFDDAVEPVSQTQPSDNATHSGQQNRCWGLGAISYENGRGVPRQGRRLFQWAHEAHDNVVRAGYLKLAQIWLDAASQLDGLPSSRIAPTPDSPSKTPRSSAD
jgi:hypothetical protein